MELCEKAAQESIVTFKNNGVLPLNKREVKTIGVIGPNANNRSSLDGNYHGTASRYVTILEGIQDYVGNEVRILYSQGSHLYLDKEEQLAQKDDRISEALSVTEYCDVVILCVGLDESLEGEEGDTGNAYASGDKKDLEFPQGQKRLMDAVLNTDTPVIVCNFTGSAMNLSLADEKAAAVIQAWYPGAQGGAALAKILFGEVSPSGKLPVTFYQSLDTLPAFEDYSMRGRTYRYLEEKPLYPFGYGLTYGEARVIKTEFVKQPKRTEDLIIQVMVKTFRPEPFGTLCKFIFRITIHLLLHQTRCCVGSQNQIFVARKKTEVTITIPKAAFQVVNQQGEKIWDSSSSTLFIGMGGVDERSQELTGQPVKKMQIVW